MCGISGVIFHDVSQSDLAMAAVKSMNIRMHTRGPDADGLWQSDGIVLGHRRLAIQDLDARSNQPFISGCGRYVIVFNGEIYNFRDLRHGLELDGVVFRTGSDTEVLLELFVREGTSMLPKLRGMFAFAIWDTLAETLFMARDPYGIKPLYYSKTEYGFVFASQVKALQTSGLVSVETELAGLVGFYLWGSVPEPWTLYRDVFALPSGHYLIVRNGQVTPPVCWQDIKVNWQETARSCSSADLQDFVRLAVTDSLQAHLVSDVPIGVFLSGGIDSGVIAGLATQFSANVEGITISFDEFVGGRDDEAPVAAAIAKHYGLKHHLRRVTKAEFEYDVPHILDAMDQPSVDGVNTWFASKAASECGYKVVLSGVGGDELFCGYSSFKQLPRATAVGKLASFMGAGLYNAPFDYFAKLLNTPKVAGLPAYMNSIEGLYFLKRSLFLPNELPMLLGYDRAHAGLFRLGGHPPGLNNAYARNWTSTIGLLESSCYLRNQLLRDSDWASMAHSLELRTPLVDTKLLARLGAYVPSFGDGIGKQMLSKSAHHVLPDVISNRPKTGFSMPMSQWLTQSIRHDAATKNSLLDHPSTPWARRWAVTVAERFCE